MDGYVGSPETFEPLSDDWCCDAQRCEHFLLANGIEDDLKQYHSVFALIGNPIFKLLMNLVVPKKLGEHGTRKFANS